MATSRPKQGAVGKEPKTGRPRTAKNLWNVPIIEQGSQARVTKQAVKHSLDSNVAWIEAQLSLFRRCLEENIPIPEGTFEGECKPAVREAQNHLIYIKGEMERYFDVIKRKEKDQTECVTGLLEFAKHPSLEIESDEKKDTVSSQSDDNTVSELKHLLLNRHKALLDIEEKLIQGTTTKGPTPNQNNQDENIVSRCKELISTLARANEDKKKSNQNATTQTDKELVGNGEEVSQKTGRKQTTTNQNNQEDHIGFRGKKDISTLAAAKADKKKPKKDVNRTTDMATETEEMDPAAHTKLEDITSHILDLRNEFRSVEGKYGADGDWRDWRDGITEIRHVFRDRFLEKYKEFIDDDKEVSENTGSEGTITNEKNQEEQVGLKGTKDISTLVAAKADMKPNENVNIKTDKANRDAATQTELPTHTELEDIKEDLLALRREFKLVQKTYVTVIEWRNWRNWCFDFTETRKVFQDIKPFLERCNSKGDNDLRQKGEVIGLSDVLHELRIVERRLIEPYKTADDRYRRNYRRISNPLSHKKDTMEQRFKLIVAEIGDMLYCFDEKTNRLREENSSLARANNNMDENMIALKNQLETIESEKAAFKSRLLEENSSLVRDNNDNNDLKENMLALKKQLRTLKSEKAELTLRLSHFMGAGMTANNPNIADLSDQNRPAKLAEQYMAIYDNEWTNAREAIGDESNLKKEEIYLELLNILLNAESECREIAATQYEQLCSRCTSPAEPGENGKLDVVHLKVINDLRKQTANLSVSSVQKKVLKESKVSVKTDAVLAYQKRCVEICWYMSLQTPPVVLDRPPREGAEFDSARYKAFTRTGKIVEFVIWPSLLLHKDGPLLCKGIAQGK